MFRNKKEKEDDGLKKLLRDAWPLDTGKERATFLQRLKLVIPPDHPGLLFLAGRIKRQTMNGYDHNGEAKWRRHGVFAFIAAWSVILLTLFLAFFAFHSYWLAPAPHNTPGGNEPGVILDNQTDDNESKTTDRYIYQFRGYKIVDSRKFTLAKATEEINKLRPMGMEIVVTGMKQVTEYFEESNGTTYHYVIYELEGRQKTESEKQNERFGVTP